MRLRLPVVQQRRAGTIASTAAILLLLLSGAPGPRPAHAAAPGPRGAHQVLADLMRKEPYLVHPGVPAQMKVVWQLTATDTCRIAWGTDTACALGSMRTSEYGPDHQHAFTIDGLAPGTKYHYRVTQGGVVRRGSFRSAPAPTAAHLKFFAYGDTRTYPAVHDQVAGGVLATVAADPEYQTFDLSAGDLVNDGNLESDWTGQFFSPSYPNIRGEMANLSILSAMGNHEGTGALFAKYFPYPFVAGRYWSFDYGPAHVVVVDQFTGYGAGSPQHQWIAADLAATTKTWKFLLLHEPGWSAGGGHPNNTSVQTVLQPLCEQYGVAIVFGGHNHYYARAVVNGVTHVTAGGGGAPLHTPDLGYPNVVTAASAHHFCTVSIEHDLLTLRALTPAGAVLDSFTLQRFGPVTGATAAGPAGPMLARPEPNPGRGTTLLRFSLPRAGRARLEIVDLSGRRVWRTEADLGAGAHEWRWDGRDGAGADAGAGLYFVRLVTPWGTRTQRLVRLR